MLLAETMSHLLWPDSWALVGIGVYAEILLNIDGKPGDVPE